MEARIVHIRRTNHRIVKITLRSEESQMPVTVINTYAPHQGKTKVEQAEHWELVHETVKHAKKHFTIWRADANGQMGKIRQGEKIQEEFSDHTQRMKKQKKATGGDK